MYFLFILTIGTAAFVIPRVSNIPSDNKPHKSTIAILEFKPTLVYYAAPAVTSFAYLQSKTVNTSQYPLIKSNKVNVFLDGNFISTSVLKNSAAPGESFISFLGVDNSIKVQYLPSKEVHENQKWFSNQQRRRYESTTIITNTRSSDSKILIVDLLPASNTEKIKVELIEPTAESLVTVASVSGEIATTEEDMITSLLATVTETGVELITQNKFTNNIVWFKTIAANKKEEVKLAYRVSWPEGGNIVIN